MSTDLPERAHLLLDVIKGLPADTHLTNPELASLMGKSARLVQLALSELEQAGLVELDWRARTPENRAGRVIRVVEVSA